MNLHGKRYINNIKLCIKQNIRYIIKYRIHYTIQSNVLVS